MIVSKKSPFKVLKRTFENTENFETTTNMHDRLHSRDIVNIAYNNKFLFSDCKIAAVLKSLNLGNTEVNAISIEKFNQDIII